MAENKTVKNKKDVTGFLNQVEPEAKRTDSFALLELFGKLTGKDPRMWGPSIVGFGEYHYVYDSGREGDSFRAGFSPRKASLTLYMIPGFTRFDEILSRLGKFKTAKSCLYIKRLADVDMEVLKELVQASLAAMAEKYPEN